MITTCYRGQPGTSNANASYQQSVLSRFTDEQVFYDKFSYDKFYLPSARVYMQHILYDKFSYDKFYFTGVNVSTSLL